MIGKRSTEEIKALTLELKKVVMELYKDRLVKIILYGSFAGMKPHQIQILTLQWFSKEELISSRNWTDSMKQPIL